MSQFGTLILGMSPYLLLGFLLAGLMHSFLPRRFFGDCLSSNNMRSVIYAALFGIPLPLCSCGVIPTAMSLRREGVSRGAVVSFMIATPQTGVDSIIATYGLMGLPFAIVRPFAALVTSLFGGAFATKVQSDDRNNEIRVETSDKEETGFLQRLRSALSYGYVTMMEDIGRWLVLGLLVAGVITVSIPSEWFTFFEGNTLASMLLVLLISIPMYVCATGSIPIAVALMLKGLTPGAALVLLMAGPACNIASMLVVRKVLGVRTMVVYILSIIIGSITFGCLIDFMQFHGIVDFTGHLVAKVSCCGQGASWFSILSSAILLILLLNALVVNKIRERKNINIKHSVNMKTFKIEGMNCNHCRLSAEKAIQNVEGVVSATVCLETGEALVEGSASEESICKAVEEIGFKCSC